MAVSTQRLFMIVIGINLMIGLAGQVYFEPTALEYSMLSQFQLETIEQQEVNMKSDTGLVGASGTATTSASDTIGNVIVWGLAIFEIIGRAALPFSINPLQFDTLFEQFVAFFIMFMRSVLWLVIGLELYMLWKNKKTS